MTSTSPERAGSNLPAPLRAIAELFKAAVASITAVLLTLLSLLATLFGLLLAALPVILIVAAIAGGVYLIVKAAGG